MMPYVQLERRKEELDAEEQASIKKEQWIDDEAARLLAYFPDSLADYRHTCLHPLALTCSCGPRAQEEYRDFILNLAYLQAQENYDLQILLNWEDACA